MQTISDTFEAKYDIKDIQGGQIHIVVAEYLVNILAGHMKTSAAADLLYQYIT